MISKALPQEKKIVYGIWKQVFAGDDGGYTDYFFRTLYKPENTLVLKESGNIVSTLMRIPHSIMLAGHILESSMILGVATIPSYRKRGCMHELMNDVLDEVEHRELVTLIQAYNPSMYTQFGFEMVYYRRRYSIHRSQIPLCSNEGLTYKVQSQDLLDVYTAYVRRFDGFYLRTKEDFDHLQEECNAEGGKLIAYYDQNKQIQGYASLYQTTQGIEVRECIYLNSVALFKLLNLALQLKPEIILHTTQDEHLEKIIKDVTWQDYGFTMARINDYDLFNRLYGSAVTSPKEAFALSGKPLFMHEYA